MQNHNILKWFTLLKVSGKTAVTIFEINQRALVVFVSIAVIKNVYSNGIFVLFSLKCYKIQSYCCILFDINLMCDWRGWMC